MKKDKVIKELVEDLGSWVLTPLNTIRVIFFLFFISTPLVIVYSGWVNGLKVFVGGYIALFIINVVYKAIFNKMYKMIKNDLNR
jgi:hypothetical protein